MSAEEFRKELIPAINKGGWGEENFKDALPIILKYVEKSNEAYHKSRVEALDFPDSLTLNQVNEITRQLLKQ